MRCVYMCHIRIITAPQDLQYRPREPKQLKLNILKGHSKRERKWWWCISDTKGENNFKKSENPETDKHVNTLFVQFP